MVVIMSISDIKDIATALRQIVPTFLIHDSDLLSPYIYRYR